MTTKAGWPPTKVDISYKITNMDVHDPRQGSNRDNGERLGNK